MRINPLLPSGGRFPEKKEPPKATQPAAGIETKLSIKDAPPITPRKIHIEDITEFTPTAQAIREWGIANWKEPDPNQVDNWEYARENRFLIYTSFDENGHHITQGNVSRSWDIGQPTHGFCFLSTDFLMPAAKEYAKLEEGQFYQFRPTLDFDFISDTFHFFTGRRATLEETNAMKAQMDGVVKELAARIKNGESTDVKTLKGTITIAGKDATIGQILEVSKIAQTLTETMENLETYGSGTYCFAEYGLATSIAGLYGQTSNNPLAGLLKGGVERLASRAVDLAHKKVLYQNMVFSPMMAGIGLETNQLFQAIDTSSRENFVSSCGKTMAQYSKQINRYESGFEFYLDFLTKKYNRWMGAIGQ